MVGLLPLQSGAENESEPRMTVGKLSPNLDGFALFHHKTLNEALKWRWILCLAPTLTLSAPSQAEGEQFTLQRLVEWKFLQSRRRDGGSVRDELSSALAQLQPCSPILHKTWEWDPDGTGLGFCSPSAPILRCLGAVWGHPRPAVSQGL